MIYKLETAIKFALSQTPFNDKGDLISCIKISQSAISVFTHLDYKVINDFGSVNIVPDIANEITLYEDKYNVPINEIDTYLRSRPRIVPIESKTKTADGKPLYNLRTLYKMSQSSPLSPENEKENFASTYIYLVVRDLYFKDTVEGRSVVESMELFEDINRIDAKLFMAEYQAADSEDILLAIAMKHGYTKVKFDSMFKILYGELPTGQIVKLEALPNLFEKGSKILKYNELAYFYKSSIPLELSYMEKSDNHCDKMKTYELFNFNKAPVKSDILNKMATAKGITLVNNLIPDEVMDYLFPQPSTKFLPKSVACMQLEEISNLNPQYPIETYDEYNRGANLETTIYDHILEQKRALTRKAFDIYIVPNINMVDAQLLEQSLDKHVIVLVKSKSYLQLSEELLNIHDPQIRAEFINKLNAFVDVGVSKEQCTSYNLIHDTVKNLLQQESSILSHFKFNDFINRVFISYSGLIFKKFMETEDMVTLMLSRGTVPKYLVKTDGKIAQKTVEPDIPVDFMTIMCLLMKLTSKDILQEVQNHRISFVRTYDYGNNKKQTVKVTVYSSSDEGFDLNVTIKKYRPFSVEKLERNNVTGCTLERLDDSYDRFIKENPSNLILAIENRHQINSAVGYYINRQLTDGKTILLIDPLYSVHEDMYDKKLPGTLRILRTKNTDMIQHVSSDLSPDVIIYHKYDLSLLKDTLKDLDGSHTDIYTINVSSEQELKSKLSMEDREQIQNINKLIIHM